MAKRFDFGLSYRDIFILKHSLEKRIENDKCEYGKLKSLNDNAATEGEKKFIKEHEEHIQCLENFIEQMKCRGHMHGENIFGKKYI